MSGRERFQRVSAQLGAQNGLVEPLELEYRLTMAKITLRRLGPEDKEEFLKALNEPWEESFGFVHYWESLADESFEKYLEIVPEIERGNLIPEEHVSSTLLFAFNKEGRIVGRTSIRHQLTDVLLKMGGHIGYGVCPSFRRQGYATEILKLSLEWMKENLPEINQVLVTCDEGNTGSQKTIENNGGVLENVIDVGNPVPKMRFWISLNQTG